MFEIGLVLSQGPKITLISVRACKFTCVLCVGNRTRLDFSVGIVLDLVSVLRSKMTCFISWIDMNSIFCLAIDINLILE